jgi:hypothetical protein
MRRSVALTLHLGDEYLVAGDAHSTQRSARETNSRIIQLFANR